MKTTKVLRPAANENDLTLRAHQLARRFNKRWGTTLYFVGERRNGNSRILEWTVAGGVPADMQLVNDDEFRLWYLEISFDGTLMDLVEVNRCVDTLFDSERDAELLERVRNSGGNDGHALVAAALVWRDIAPSELKSPISEQLRSSHPQAVRNALMAAMLLQDSSLLPALSDARRNADDESVVSAIDYLVSMLEDDQG